MRRTARAVLASLALVGAALTAAPAQAAGPLQAPAAPQATGCSPGVGVGLVDTAGVEKDPRAAVYVVASVRPGATYTRRFQVCNGTAAPVTVRLYGGDATIGNGSFSVTEGRTQGDVARWVTVDPATVTVPPQQRVIATATFRVPSSATQGERYGVLLAELPAQQGGGGVAVASRVGVRVYLEVGTGGDPKSDFTIDSLQAVRRADGTPAVLARVHNTGARALDLRGDLRLTDGPGGLSAGPFPAQVGTTLGPGDSAPVTVPLPKAITGGPWLATIDMKSGLLERKASARVSFPDAAGVEAAPVVAKALPLYKDRTFLGPVAGSLIGLLFLIFIVLGYLATRRRARDRREEQARG